MDDTENGIRKARGAIPLSVDAMYDEFARWLAGYVQKAVALMSGVAIGSCLTIHLMTDRLSLKGLLGWTAAFLALTAASYFIPRLVLGPKDHR